MADRLDVETFLHELGRTPSAEWPELIAPVCRGELILTQAGHDLAPFQWPTVVRNQCGIPSPLPDLPAPIVDGDLLRAEPDLTVWAFWQGRRHGITSPEALEQVFGVGGWARIRLIAPWMIAAMPQGLLMTGPDAWAVITAGLGTLPPPAEPDDPDGEGEWLGVKNKVEREWSLLLGNMITTRNYLAGQIRKVSRDIDP